MHYRLLNQFLHQLARGGYESSDSSMMPNPGSLPHCVVFQMMYSYRYLCADSVSIICADYFAQYALVLQSGGDVEIVNELTCTYYIYIHLFTLHLFSLDESTF